MTKLRFYYFASFHSIIFCAESIKIKILRYMIYNNSNIVFSWSNPIRNCYLITDSEPVIRNGRIAIRPETNVNRMGFQVCSSSVKKL